MQYDYNCDDYGHDDYGHDDYGHDDYGYGGYKRGMYWIIYCGRCSCQTCSPYYHIYYSTILLFYYFVAVIVCMFSRLWLYVLFIRGFVGEKKSIRNNKLIRMYV